MIEQFFYQSPYFKKDFMKPENKISPVPPNAKLLNSIASVLSVIVLSTVLLMRRVKIDVDYDLSFLPTIHALLNTGVAICLGIAIYYIKRKNINMHRTFIYMSMILSFLFLLSYVMYHFTTEEVKYCHEGGIRYVYFFILITHIALAGLTFPFILFTFVRGYTGQVEAHRRMAKWVYPFWMYVALTGPIVYLMLKSCM